MNESQSTLVLISKSKLINTIFVLSFPWYGFGTYVMPKYGYAIGVCTCSIPFVLIVGIYLIDALYRQNIVPRVNKTFYLCCAAILSIVISVQVGLYYKSPIINNANGALLTVLFINPFISSVIVQIYNRNNKKFDMAFMVLKGFMMYLGLNLLGIAAGMHNLIHGFPDRISPPFAYGIYDTAHVLSMFNLMLLFYLKDFNTRPFRFAFLSLIYVANLAIMVNINSRLSFMIFLIFTILFMANLMRVVKGLFVISLFTMPLLMSFSLLVYEILSMPLFAEIMERVSKEDVTTFNGRTYIWTAAADWLQQDRRGLLFGNGFNGQYHLRLLEKVAKMWGQSGSYRLHMHSAFLEMLVDQGVVGILLMYAVYYRGYMFYRKHYMDKTQLAPLFAAFVYLMFVWQIDIFGYGTNTGFVLLFVFMAPAAVEMNRGADGQVAIS